MLCSLLDAGAVSETDGSADTVGEAAGADQAVLPSAGKGRVPYPLEWMLRVHCVQLFYNVGDPGMEGMLHEIESVGRFKGTVWMPASLRRQHRGRTGKENMIPR